MRSPINLTDLYGKHTLRAIKRNVNHPFDPDASGLAIELGGVVVMFFEDPSDGYRSMLAAPLVAADSLHEFGGDLNYLHIPVLIRDWKPDPNTDGSNYGEVDGIEMIDRRNGKVILTVGTRNTDDYYPSFVCDWGPGNLQENAR